jgi:hypothetical protein
MTPDPRPARTERLLAAGNLVVAVVIKLAVFRAWPVRSLALEIAAGVVAALLVASGVGLVLRVKWADALTRVAAIALLVAGVSVMTVLTLGMTFARAVGGAGAGPGAVMFGLALALVVPYGIGYPIGLLVWLRSRGRVG